MVAVFEIGSEIYFQPGIDLDVNLGTTAGHFCRSRTFVRSDILEIPVVFFVFPVDRECDMFIDFVTVGEGGVPCVVIAISGFYFCTLINKRRFGIDID